MTTQPHLIVVLTEAEKRDQLIRQALQSEPISMYPDFIAAVTAALDDLDRFRSERSYIVGCNEGFEAAIDQAARLIEEYSIMDTSGGKELSPRIDGNREGLHYAISIRALVAGNKVPVPTTTANVAGATYSQDEYDEAYEIGKRDGYSEAVQQIDQLTGGDGEYRYCLGDEGSARHTPGPAEMIQRIVGRFEVLNLLDEATKSGRDQEWGDTAPAPRAEGDE